MPKLICAPFIGALPATAHAVDRPDWAFCISPSDFARLIADETEEWVKAIKCASIMPD
jgi:hypothetical protein